ncbi:MAG: type II secretion system F family protein [bacterium]|nr:type II secretion system F family protein [bacterium]
MGLFSSQISTKRLVPVCRQLATSNEAGFPILKSLSMLADGQRDRTMRRVLTSMHDDIKDGKTLGQAAKAQSKYLPTFFIQLLTSGEVGGKLDIMMRDLADYFEDRLNMQRSVTRAMIYPCIQLAAAWFLGTFALRLIPKIMAGLGGRGSFDIGAYFQEYALFQARAMSIVAVVFAVSVILSRMGLLGWVTGTVTTHLWPLSIVTRKFALARFFRSMSLLLGAGLRVDHCIEQSAAVVSNPYIEKDLLKAVPAVRDGQMLVEAFSGSRQLTSMAREMLLVGETSGNLEGQLRKISEYHLEEATHAVNLATSVMTVLIILGVALLIGFIVIMFWTQFYGGMMDELGI